MNIWALDKDLTIKHLLLLLAQEFGTRDTFLLDVEQLHPKAVRIGSTASPATAYIYTYGQAEHRYGLHLEYPHNDEGNISEQEDMYEDVGFEKLLEMLRVHLQCEPLTDQQRLGYRP